LQRKAFWSFSRQSDDPGILLRAHRVHISCGEGHFEAVGGSLVQTLEQVPVGIQSGFDRRVTEPFLNDLRVLSLRDQERCVGVAQIVESAGLPDRGLHSGQPDPTPEVTAPDGTTAWSGKHEAGAVGLHRQVGSQHLDEKWRHADGAT